LLHEKDNIAMQPIMIISRKQYLYSISVILIFLVLIVRFFYLQIYKQAQYLRASEKNRIREVVIEPTRGLIIDKNGEVLVDNHPSYSVYVIPFEVKDADSVLDLAGQILSMESSEIKNIINHGRSSIFTPVKLKRQIDFITLSRIEEQKLDLPGIIYQIEPRRYYSSGVRAPHVFGYLGEITRQELNQIEFKGFRLGDIVGKKGLERFYEKELRGLRGYQYIEVDALGREIRKLKDKPEILPLPGKNLHLTIDAQLQYALEARMDTLKGGAVVIDCTNGEVLALVSKPDYDPEIFTKPISLETWKELINDPDKPLYDRMVQSLYPPGSTYKLVLAAAALESGIIKPNWKAFCPGYTWLGRKRYDCWNLSGHGELDLYGAIEQSCNVYFYKLGLKTRLDNWAKFSQLFLFDKPTGIDLIDEKSGQVPDRDYLDQQYGKDRWTEGMILNLSIGQGDLLVTPLQMVRLAMIIANEGICYSLHLLNYLEDPIDGTKHWAVSDSVRINGISPETYKILKQGMYRVTHGGQGTGRAAVYKDITMAGKTGTAENPHGEAHAWFIGYAPADKPKIAFCILVENGGSGGKVAAPIAREVIKNYFYRLKVNRDKI
jgi:penicillin-binding protein 2